MPSSKFILRSELSTLKPYNAGLSEEDVQDRAGGKPIAKLASNENPYPMPASIGKAMADALERACLYPDPVGRKLLDRLAQHVGCAADALILGNGSEDLLNILARSFLRPGDAVVTLYPSFPLHEDYAAMMGARVTAIDLTEKGEIDFDRLLEAVAQPVRMTIFSNPMNPAGLWLDPEQMALILRAQHPDSLLCVDEAYYEYAMAEGGVPPSYSGLAPQLKTHDKPLLLLRTFSKAYGLAGLRIGYGMTNSATLRRGLDLVRTPFNVNAIAQAGALAALDEQQAMEGIVAKVVRERERVAQGLAALGVSCLPSRGNFLFFQSNGDSQGLSERLICEGVIVKPWKQAGYSNWLRVSIGLVPENDQFLRAVARLTSS